MKLANFSDLHARGKDLDVFAEQLNAGFRIAKEKGCTGSALAGDIFDRGNIYDRKASTGEICDVVIDAFASCTHPIIVIPGQHDMTSNNNVTALTVVAKLPDVFVMNEPQWFKGFPIERSGAQGLKIACVPWSWTESAEDVISRLVAMPEMKSGKRLLLAHLQVVGAIMSGTQTHEGGSFSISRKYLDSLPFDRFAFADFHKRQDLTDGRGGFVGALRQVDFGEEGNPQGFEIWDTETGKVEWIEIDCAPVHKNFVIKEGDPVPIPIEGELHKIKTDGFKLSRKMVQDLEDAGSVVEPIIARKERIERDSTIPPGILNQPPDLVHLFDRSQEPRIEREQLDRILTTVEDLK